MHAFWKQRAPSHCSPLNLIVFVFASQLSLFVTYRRRIHHTGAPPLTKIKQFPPGTVRQLKFYTLFTHNPHPNQLLNSFQGLPDSATPSKVPIVPDSVGGNMRACVPPICRLMYYSGVFLKGICRITIATR